MTESDSAPGPDRQRQLEEALRRERKERIELEQRSARLENQLEAERTKLQRMTSRRSVRLALRLAQLGAPAVKALRNLRSGQPPAQAQRTQDEVQREIRRLRPDAGPETGPLVTMVVLNRDGAHHLRRLLPGLRDVTHYRSFELVVVDNGSTDESLALLETDWGFRIRTIRNVGNVSFSRGCNQGLEVAKGDYVLLLNNDVAPINPGWLGAMVTELESDTSRGAAGALLVYPERPGFTSRDPNTGADLTVQHRGISFRWRRNADAAATVPWAYNLGVGEDPTRTDLVRTTDVPAVTAACMLVRTDLLRRLGGLDERFVYGMEDVDICLRIGKEGNSIAVVGSAVLFHHEFGTQSETAAARKTSYGLSNVQHFAEKWAPDLSRQLQLEQLTPSAQSLHHRGTPTVAITVTRDDPKAGWGDWYTAHELGDALEGVGFEVVYAERHQDRWYDLGEDVATVICLMDGYDVRRAPRDAVTIAWVRNWTDRWIDQPWFGHHDIYIPSSQVSADLLSAAGVPVTPVVPLATNEERFYPQTANAVYVNDFSVTSNYWKAARPGIEEVIVRPGESFSIFGKGWEGVPRLSRYVRGQLPYEELAEVYSSSKIVIDETATPTLPYGAINSRVFDATAAGALVITNNRIGSEELFSGELPVYSDAASQRALLDKYLADDELRNATAESLRQTVLSAHTYTHRAIEIPKAAIDMAKRPRIALKIGSPDQQTAHLWGDTHFAGALGAALRKHDVVPSVHLLADWETPAAQCVDVAIHIRGLGTYVPKPTHKNILWVISHPDEVTAAECRDYDLVLVASQVFADQLRTQVDVPVEVMYQATDPSRFYPNPDPELATELLFAGNSRGQQRMAVQAALDIDAPLTVYGQGWEEILPDEVLAGDHFPNERLGELYASAEVTLNDHWPEMARHGFISNRVFDIIASGGVVFTDPVVGLETLFAGLVPVFDSAEGLRALIEEHRRDRSSFADRMSEAREIVLRDHTFDARARRIVEIINELGWQAG